MPGIVTATVPITFSREEFIRLADMAPTKVLHKCQRESMRENVFSGANKTDRSKNDRRDCLVTTDCIRRSTGEATFGERKQIFHRFH